MKYYIAGGTASMVLGLALIPLINLPADNWAAFVSPALIVGGIITIIFGLARA